MINCTCISRGHWLEFPKYHYEITPLHRLIYIGFITQKELSVHLYEHFHLLGQIGLSTYKQSCWWDSKHKHNPPCILQSIQSFIFSHFRERHLISNQHSDNNNHDKTSDYEFFQLKKSFLNCRLLKFEKL